MQGFGTNISTCSFLKRKKCIYWLATAWYHCPKRSVSLRPKQFMLPLLPWPCTLSSLSQPSTHNSHKHIHPWFFLRTQVSPSSFFTQLEALPLGSHSAIFIQTSATGRPWATKKSGLLSLPSHSRSFLDHWQHSFCSWFIIRWHDLHLLKYWPEKCLCLISISALILASYKGRIGRGRWWLKNLNLTLCPWSGS